MSEASSDFHARPVPATPRGASAVPRSRHPDPWEPEADPRLAAALSFDDPVFPLDPPLVDVRIPVEPPHADATVYSRNALRHQFPGAQVGDDLHMLFSEPGKQQQSRLAPDVFVALNVPRRDTLADYDADLLGPPDFVLEVLSRSTWKHDLGRKLDCYQGIGVRECLLFNATGEGLPGAAKELWGFSLTPERREPLREVALPNGARGVYSAVLGLVAYVTERTPPSGPGEIWALTMRWHDPATAEDIPDYEEVRARAAQARARAARAREAKAQAGEARARAEEAQARAQARAEAEEAQRTMAEAESARAEAEARAEASQRRTVELEEQLRRLRGGP